MTDRMYYRGYRGFTTLEDCIAFLSSKTAVTIDTLIDEHAMPLGMATRFLAKMEADLLIKADPECRGRYEVNLEVASQFCIDRREAERLLTVLSGYDINALSTLDTMWREHLYYDDSEFDTVFREELQNLWSAGVIHCFNGKYVPSVDSVSIQRLTFLTNKDLARESEKVLFAEPILYACLTAGELPREVIEFPLLTSYCTEYISDNFALYRHFEKMPPFRYASRRALYKLDGLFDRMLGAAAVKWDISTADALLDGVTAELGRIKDIPPLADARVCLSTSSMMLAEVLGYIVNRIKELGDGDVQRLKSL